MRDLCRLAAEISSSGKLLGRPHRMCVFCNSCDGSTATSTVRGAQILAPSQIVDHAGIEIGDIVCVSQTDDARVLIKKLDCASSYFWASKLSPRQSVNLKPAVFEKAM